MQELQLCTFLTMFIMLEEKNHLSESLQYPWYLLISTDEEKADANCENYELNCHCVLSATPLNYKHCCNYTCNEETFLCLLLYKQLQQILYI